MAYAFECPNDVEAGIREGRCRIVGLLDDNGMRETARCDDAPGALHLRSHRRDSDHSCATPLGEPHAAASNSASSIEYSHAWLDISDLGEHSIRVEQRVGM